MNSLKQNIWVTSLQWLVTLGAFIILVLKAWNYPFIMDESTSFVHFVHIGDMLPGMGRWTTNNHFLNSWLMWLEWKVFGMEEFVLRIHSLLSFIVFAYYAMRMGRHIAFPPLRILFLLTLYGGLFMIDFFALARGYGLSFAAIFGGVYHQSRSFKYAHPSDEKWSFTWMIVAILANFNMQFYYLVFFGIELLRIWPLSGRRKWKFLLIRIIPVGLTIWVSFLLKAHGSLDLGQTSGLTFTFRSLFFAITGSMKPMLVYATWAWIGILILGTLKRSFNLNEGHFPLHLLLIAYVLGNVLMVWINHVFLGVLYPVHRSSMHWYLYLLPAAFIAFKYLPKWIWIPGTLAPLIFCGFLLRNSIERFDIHRHHETFWSREQIDDSFYLELKDRTASFEPPAIVAAGWRNLRPWYYKQLKIGGGVPRVQMDIYKDTLADFVIADTSMNSGYPMYKEILVDTRNGLNILERKKPLKRHLAKSFHVSTGYSIDEVRPLINRQAIYCPGPFQVSIEMKLAAESHLPMKSNFEYFFESQSHEKLKWDRIRVDYMYGDVNDGVIKIDQVFTPLEEEEFLFSLRFNNKREKNCKIESLSCYIYELK